MSNLASSLLSIGLNLRNKLVSKLELGGLGTLDLGMGSGTERTGMVVFTSGTMLAAAMFVEVETKSFGDTGGSPSVRGTPRLKGGVGVGVVALLIQPIL